MSSVNDNYVKKYGFLDPSVYSSRKFIEYIAKYLKKDAVKYGLQHVYNFIEGININIEEKQISEGVTNVTIHHQESIPPSGSITQFTAEYGEKYAAKQAAIELSVTRKTYPLEVIKHLTVSPAVDLVKADLSYLTEEDTITIAVKNAAAIDGNGTVMASGGSFKDSAGQSGKLDSKISRLTRHFWGSSDSNSGDEDFLTTKFSSLLGDIPKEITIVHGSSPTYFVIATPLDIEVLAQGIIIPTVKVTKDIKSYAGDITYTKTYNIYISTATSTGTYTYQIKQV
jgi:hypothetical protein